MKWWSWTKVRTAMPAMATVSPASIGFGTITGRKKYGGVHGLKA